jgi:hypothetical protein
MRLDPMFRALSAFVRRFLACTCTCLGALACSACSSDCGDAGCVSAVFADGTVETSSQRLIVTACLNQRCASADVDRAAASCKKLTLSSDSRVCFSEAAPGRLRVALEVHSIGGELAFNSGDVLGLEITEQDTTSVVTNVQLPVTYEAVYPNGPDCDDQPCQAASVTF